jgi:hypothetical protein
MLTQRPTLRIEPGADDRFYLSVDHKIRAVFDSYDDALDGLKTTVEILDEPTPF